MENNKDKWHKAFERGKAITVKWRKHTYVGLYRGWSDSENSHMVKFPVLTPYGTRLETLFVKDKNIG